MPNVAFRVHTVSAFRNKRSAGAVVATDTASADADRDNGVVALYGAPRHGTDDERATRRADWGCGNR
jgi:hypothetical protein